MNKYAAGYQDALADVLDKLDNDGPEAAREYIVANTHNGEG